jgi:hypothetical protein
MKNNLPIGIAALLIGSAGGYFIGSHNGSTPPAPVAVVAKDGKVTQRPASETASARSTKARSLEDALRTPGQMGRIQALMDLYSGMSADQLKSEADKLDRLPMAQRMMASMLLFGRWAEVDPNGALSYSKGMGFAGMFVRPTILQSWASSDPVNAAKYYSANPREFSFMGGGPMGGMMGGDNGAGTIASEWAKLDPDAALAWANGLEGRDKSGAVTAALREIAAKDPQKAIQVAGTLTGDDQARAYREIAGQYAASDYSAAKAWISTLPADQQAQAMSEAITSLAKQDPTKAAAELSSIPEGRERDRALGDVANAMSKTDPAAAVALVASSGGERADNSLREPIAAWVAQDSAAALSYINNSLSGDMKDTALASYVFSNTAADPSTLMSVAEGITDEGERSRAISVNYMRWSNEDKTAADEYIQSSSALSDEQKQRITSGRGMWGGGPGGGRGMRGGR